MTETPQTPEDTTVDSQNFQSKKSSKKILIALSAAALVAIAVAAFFLTQSEDSKSDSKKANTESSSSSASSSTSTTAQKSDTKSNEAQLASDIKKANGIEADVKFDDTRNAYVISWVIPRAKGQQPDTINDQSNAGRQAQLDAVSTLQAVKDSSVEFENVRLDISAIRADAQGKDETVNMIKATYSSALINKTDFETIDEANIFAIGEDVVSNPDFDYYLYLDLTV